ncbi:MAG: DUF2835 domain-containing protein [Verrucomicrobiota bacterium]|nr:DUF2835 domain-containing protein [Limisphaera sp.]MDW8381648.1 DUF2835 domain-containing protein [Verrucomicrobiota bacterium]
MPRFEFDLDLSPEEFLAWYRGEARSVRVRSHQGLVVEFPARLLQPYLRPEGIRGRFVLTCDAQFRNARLDRLHPPLGTAPGL